jgi:hypothetical protein
MCTVESVVLAVTAYGKIYWYLRFNKSLLSALLFFIYILYPAAYFYIFSSSQPSSHLGYMNVSSGNCDQNGCGLERNTSVGRK